jgi:hypothetical protein
MSAQQRRGGSAPAPVQAYDTNAVVVFCRLPHAAVQRRNSTTRRRTEWLQQPALGPLKGSVRFSCYVSITPMLLPLRIVTGPGFLVCLL